MNKQELIEKNYKLVWSVVNKFSYFREEKEDLFQSGCIGLILAARKFNPALGNAFSTFAIPYILGEIKNYLCTKNQIKVSKKILTLEREINKLLEKDSSLSLQDVANKLNLPYEEIVMGYSHKNRPLSLEASLKDDQTTLGNIVTVVNRYDIDKSALEIKDLIQGFSRLEQRLLFYRFYYGYNQSEIARRLNISQSKVSRLEKKLTEALRKNYLIN